MAGTLSQNSKLTDQLKDEAQRKSSSQAARHSRRLKSGGGAETIGTLFCLRLCCAVSPL